MDATGIRKVPGKSEVYLREEPGPGQYLLIIEIGQFNLRIGIIDRLSPSPCLVIEGYPILPIFTIHLFLPHPGAPGKGAGQGYFQSFRMWFPH
jgi:hypothetical protein